jgi:hypothetical protein
MVNATMMVEIHPFQCKNPCIVYTQCNKKKQDCSDSRSTQEVIYMKEEKFATFLGSQFTPSLKMKFLIQYL